MRHLRYESRKVNPFWPHLSKSAQTMCTYIQIVHVWVLPAPWPRQSAQATSPPPSHPGPPGASSGQGGQFFPIWIWIWIWRAQGGQPHSGFTIFTTAGVPYGQRLFSSPRCSSGHFFSINFRDRERHSGGAKSGLGLQLRSTNAKKSARAEGCKHSFPRTRSAAVTQHLQQRKPLRENCEVTESIESRREVLTERVTVPSTRVCRRLPRRPSSRLHHRGSRRRRPPSSPDLLSSPPSAVRRRRPSGLPSGPSGGHRRQPGICCPSFSPVKRHGRVELSRSRDNDLAWLPRGSEYRFRRSRIRPF